MTTSDIRRTAAAIACTVVMSATCLLGAIAPAQTAAYQGDHATVSVARPVA